MSERNVTTETEIHVYDDPDFWWSVGWEKSVGGGSGVRICYHESDRKVVDSDFVDIVASPKMLRSIAAAIVRIADEQEGA